MTVEAGTTHRDYALPDATNKLNVDVLRLVEALNAIDTDVNQLFTQVNLKAPNVHAHAISDVTGLQAALDSKASAGGSIAFANLSDVNVSSVANNMFLRYDSVTSKWIPVAFDAAMIASGTINAARMPAYLASTALSSTYAPIIHAHTIPDVSGLQSALDGKAAAAHTHTIANVTNLQATLDGKAPTSHTHAIDNVTGLQTALDGKAAASHAHSIANVSGLQTALDAKAPLNSPGFTGTPTAPTPAAGDNSTKIATTEFVRANGGVVLLGTISTADGVGTTVTLSGLNLTGYKFLHVILIGVDPTSSTANDATLTVGGYVVYTGQSAINRLVIHDLATGYSTTTNLAGAMGGVTSASTSYSATTTSGGFKGGTIYIYGVK